MHIRRFALFAFASLAACSSSSNGTAPSTTVDAGECPAGQVFDATSQSCTTCQDDTKPSADGASCVKVGWQGCPQAFVVDPSGYGCVDVSPAVDCAAGTMPTLGSSTCQPVGTTSCAAGFSADPSGWGCVAISPPAACSGATMEKLGSATCVPVGDCSAPFPPAAATLFVSPSATVDATHFKTIGAALASATGGITIAVDTGSYAEAVTITQAAHLVGRCAAQVTVAATATAAPGIAISAVTGASISGVTISGHSPGIQASSGASLTVSSSVVDANIGSGVSVTGAGSTVEIDDSVVRSTTATASPLTKGDGVQLSSGAHATIQRSAIVANTEEGIYATDPNTKLTISDSIVADTVVNGAGEFGLGIDVVTAAVAEIDRVLIARNHEAGIVAAAGGDVHLLQSVVANHVPSAGGYGHGLTIVSGHALIEESTIAANVEVGISVEDARGAIEAKNSVIRGNLPNASHAKGAGVTASSGGVATLTGVALVGNSEEGAFADGAGSSLTMNAAIARDGVMLPGNTAGNGAVAQNGGKLVLQGSALIANHESGLLMFDPVTSANVTLSIIASQLPSLGNQFGRGVVLQNGPTLTMSQSLVASNHDIGISARGAGSTVKMSESVVRDTHPQVSDGAHGRALNIIEQAQATVTKCELLHNTEVAALVSGTSAQLSIDSSVLASTALDTKTRTAGRGFAAQSSGIGSLSGSAVLDNFQVGVSAAGASTQLTLDTSLIDGTKAIPDTTFGHGLLANDHGTLVLSSSTSRGAAGVGVIIDNSTATVSRCRILNNSVGINVQNGSSLTQVDAVPAAPTTLDVDVSNDTVFDGNQTRIGSDQLPIPAALN